MLSQPKGRVFSQMAVATVHADSYFLISPVAFKQARVSETCMMRARRAIRTLTAAAAAAVEVAIRYLNSNDG